MLIMGSYFSFGFFFVVGKAFPRVIYFFIAPGNHSKLPKFIIIIKKKKISLPKSRLIHAPTFGEIIVAFLL